MLSVTGSLASTVGQINPFRYRGYYYDTETGFYYLQTRYYDPEVGRFLNADGIIGANGGVLGYNMFAYCNNDPVMGYDPSGKWIIRSFAIAICDGRGGNSEDFTGINDKNNAAGNLDYKDSPPSSPNFKAPKKGNKRVKNPNGAGNGWEDAEGNVWVWTPGMHGGKGWTVQYPNGGHRHEYPDGHVRYATYGVRYKEPSWWSSALAGFLMLIIIADDVIGVVEDEPLLAGCYVLISPTEELFYHCDVCGEEWLS